MEENKFLEWLYKHWSKLLLSVLAVACIVVWSERLFKTSKQEHSHDFILTQNIFERFQKGEFLDSETLSTAENLLKRHPEMGSKYNALLTLTYFAQHQKKQASEHARALLTQTSGQLPELYKEYAQGTLLIAEEDYAAAWAAARSLEQKIQNRETYLILDGMNQLRLIFLANQLQLKEEVQSYWKRFKSHPAFLLIESSFHEGHVTLSDFFEEPGKVLDQKS